MSDLIEWLRAQLDADEATAGSATSGPWSNDDPLARDGVFASAIDGFVVDCDYAHMGPFAVHNATHIALHDPASVLADIAAKRAILDAYEEARSFYRDPANLHIPAGEAHGLLTALRHLTTAYADRPGFREEWRP